MRFQTVILLFLHLYLARALVRGNSTQPFLNISALASRDGYSVIECWQLAAAPTYARSALNWILGVNSTQAELSTIEPRTVPGEAWAPHVQ